MSLHKYTYLTEVEEEKCPLLYFVKFGILKSHLFYLCYLFSGGHTNWELHCLCSWVRD